MEFKPFSEIEIFNLLPEGDYDFKVKEDKIHFSKNTGNQSRKLTISIYDDKGTPTDIIVYLTPAYKKLFKHFFDATGNEEMFQSGKFPEGCAVNMSGRCKVKIEYPEMGSQYDPKNIISDFLKPSLSEPKQQIDSDLNDPLPF